MFSRALALTLVAMPAFALAGEGSILKPLEQAIETSSAETRIPSSTPSTLYIKPCGSCAPKSLEINASTRFFIGKEVVAQQAFVNSYAKRSAPAGLVVLFDATSAAITRVITPATTASQRK